MQVGKTEREKDMLEREREMMSVPGTGTLYIHVLTLGAHAQRGLRVVCLSVRHLTSGASVRLETAVTYSTGGEGKKICGVFSENAPLQS